MANSASPESRSSAKYSTDRIRAIRLGTLNRLAAILQAIMLTSSTSVTAINNSQSSIPASLSTEGWAALPTTVRKSSRALSSLSLAASRSMTVMSLASEARFSATDAPTSPAPRIIIFFIGGRPWSAVGVDLGSDSKEHRPETEKLEPDSPCVSRPCRRLAARAEFAGKVRRESNCNNKPSHSHACTHPPDCRRPAGAGSAGPAGAELPQRPTTGCGASGPGSLSPRPPSTGLRCAVGPGRRPLGDLGGGDAQHAAGRRASRTRRFVCGANCQRAGRPLASLRRCLADLRGSAGA